MDKNKTPKDLACNLVSKWRELKKKKKTLKEKVTAKQN